MGMSAAVGGCAGCGCVRGVRFGVVWPPHVCTNSAAHLRRGASSARMVGRRAVASPVRRPEERNGTLANRERSVGCLSPGVCARPAGDPAETIAAITSARQRHRNCTLWSPLRAKTPMTRPNTCTSTQGEPCRSPPRPGPVRRLHPSGRSPRVGCRATMRAPHSTPRSTTRRRQLGLGALGGGCHRGNTALHQAQFAVVVGPALHHCPNDTHPDGQGRSSSAFSGASGTRTSRTACECQESWQGTVCRLGVGARLAGSAAQPPRRSRRRHRAVVFVEFGSGRGKRAGRQWDRGGGHGPVVATVASSRRRWTMEMMVSASSSSSSLTVRLRRGSWAVGFR